MPAAERNRRVALRNGGTDRPVSTLPTLYVPAGAAITPGLFPLLRTLTAHESCRIIWHPQQPPLEWRAPDTPAAPGTLKPGTVTPAGVAGGMAGGEEFVLHEPLVLDVSTATARRAAAWRLLNASGKPQDGWLSKHVHRRVSRVFSYVFLQLGWSANVATLFAFLIGLTAAVMMAQTSHLTMIAGGFLFWFASIADGIDGEVARLTLTESRFGEQLDTGVDQLTHLSGLVGVMIGWWRQGIGAAGLGLAVTVLAGTPLLLLWAMALVRQARQTDQFFVPTKPIEIAIFKAAAETGALPLRATAAFFILLRREAFSFTFFLLSLVTAQRVAIPAVMAVGLVVVLATFTAYGSTLRQALRETVGPPPADTARPAVPPGSSRQS